MNLNLSKRERYILVVTISIITAALLYNFIFEGLFKKNSTLNNKIIIKKSKIEKSLRSLEKQGGIVNEYNSHVSSLKSMSKILTYIETQAASSGIKTANIRPRSPIQKELYNEYVIEIQIEGEFRDIVKFVSGLLKPPIFISTKEFELRTVEVSSSYLKGTLIVSTLII